MPVTSLELFIRSVRRVAKFSGISIFEAMQLPHDVFLLCFKEAIIEDLMQTTEGQKYLQKAWRLQQTRPDYDRLARLPGYKREKEVIPDGGQP